MNQGGRGRKSVESVEAHDVAFGPEEGGVRFGLVRGSGAFEAGGSIRLTLVCENRGAGPVDVFGFAEGYPRSLRLSPPKAHRPYIRVSFGDVNVLHPPDAFVRLDSGERAETGLDLSFAFDRRGAGAFRVAFAYDPVRAGGRLHAYMPPEGGEARTELVDLVVSPPESLREAGISASLEAELDGLLLAGDANVGERLRELGDGGATYAARRLSRVLSSGAESRLGWRSLDALALLGDAGLAAVRKAADDLPHARIAYDFASEWLWYHQGGAPADVHLPFITSLERAALDPASRGNLLLTFTACDSDVHGTRRLQVLGDGERIVSGRAPYGEGLLSRRSTLSPGKMQALLEALRYGAVWLLRPLRETGIVDEPRPELEVQLALGETFIRRIALFQGEWRSGPASTLFDLLERLWREAPPESVFPPAR